MLGKLFRQEIRAQGKGISGMYGVLAIATVFMALIFFIERVAAGRMFQIDLIACCIYGMTVVVIIVASFIYLCFHFYQSMYSGQGYLTHTLPVKTSWILNVKVAVSFGFLFLTGILSILSFVLLGIAKNRIQIGELVAVFWQGLHTASGELGVPEALILVFLLFMLACGCLNALLMFFAGSSIGQLSHRSKGACGIAAGVGLYYISQIVTLVLVVLCGWLYTVGVGPRYVQGVDARIVVWVMVGASLLALCWAAVYYMICRIVVQRHLNLE